MEKFCDLERKITFHYYFGTGGSLIPYHPSLSFGSGLGHKIPILNKHKIFVMMINSQRDKNKQLFQILESNLDFWGNEYL